MIAIFGYYHAKAAGTRLPVMSLLGVFSGIASVSSDTLFAYWMSTMKDDWSAWTVLLLSAIVSGAILAQLLQRQV